MRNAGHGEVLVGAQIVDPEAFGPRLFAGLFSFEEQHVGFHALGVEDAGGQAQQGMDIAAFEQLAADTFAGSTFEQHVVGANDACGSADLQFPDDVLEEVERFVTGRRPKIVALVFLFLGGDLAVVVDDGVAVFLAKGGLARIRSNFLPLDCDRESVRSTGGSSSLAEPMPCR